MAHALKIRLAQVDDVRVDTTYTEFGADGQPMSDEDEEADMVRHEQTIWVGQTSSGCERWVMINHEFLDHHDEP